MSTVPPSSQPPAPDPSRKPVPFSGSSPQHSPSVTAVPSDAAPSYRRLGIACLYAVAFIAASAVGGMSYFHFGDPQHTCASCHEMGGMHSQWAQSSHRTLHCRNCHGGSLTLDLHALEAHLNRVVQHVAGDLSKPIHLAERDILRAHDSCRACHPQSFADWQSSRHAATYRRFFLDPAHNKVELPADDCFRCHGMFYGRGIATLITPLDKKGPWQFREPTQADRPAIPCLACHQIHTRAGSDQTAKAHFYDCREELYFAAGILPSPTLIHEGKPLRVSTDPRHRLCVQCHAPSQALFHRPGTGDDRTPRGVHEGLSCLDCHQPHSNSARASCANCHPANSHCGLDVAKMDTTFASKTSRHDIHTVSCGDCHTTGVPKPTVKMPAFSK